MKDCVKKKHYLSGFHIPLSTLKLNFPCYFDGLFSRFQGPYSHNVHLWIRDLLKGEEKQNMHKYKWMNNTLVLFLTLNTAIGELLNY